MFGRVYYGTDFHLTNADRKMFNHGSYECKALMQEKSGMPVAILQSKDPNCPIWKVTYGFSCVVFPTYADAMDFCRGRFKRLDGREV